MFLRLKLEDEVWPAVVKLSGGSGNWIQTKLRDRLEGMEEGVTRLYERLYLDYSFINQRRIIAEGNFA